MLRSRRAIALVSFVVLALVGFGVTRAAVGAVPRARGVPSVRAFCAAHPVPRHRFGFWAAPPSLHPSFAVLELSAARWDHRQFDEIAGQVCGMLCRVEDGHTVLVAAPTRHAPRRVVPVTAAQLRRLIEKLERLPDADAPTLQ